VALGGTAVGTGVNTHPEFGARACGRLAVATGFPIREAENHFQAQSNLDTLVQAHGALNAAAAGLLKIANDLRWMGSGPRAGLGEVALPEVQPGSSIMPGKVNPVIAESLAMACLQVMGNNATVSMAGQWSEFELNVMEPVAVHNLLQSVALLSAATRNFIGRCLRGLRATERGPQMVERGLAIATGLVPALGYDSASRIAKEAAHTGETVREVARRLSGLPEAELDRLLDPARMTAPGITLL
jgi:fumarate hydratase class II